MTYCTSHMSRAVPTDTSRPGPGTPGRIPDGPNPLELCELTTKCPGTGHLDIGQRSSGKES